MLLDLAFSVLLAYNDGAVYLRQEGGVNMEIFMSFILSVLAGVVAYYICKWLDGDE